MSITTRHLLAVLAAAAVGLGAGLLVSHQQPAGQLSAEQQFRQQQASLLLERCTPKGRSGRGWLRRPVSGGAGRVSER
jgi:uncharacterized protein HemX